MATYEKATVISVQVKVTSSVAAAKMFRFAKWVATTPVNREVATLVPGALGAVPAGVIAMKPDAAGVVNGYCTVPMHVPDGGVGLVELGEAVTDLAVPLRVGGNSTEVDGAAYLANATGDVIVGYPLELGSVGQIISFQFIGNGGLAA